MKRIWTKSTKKLLSNNKGLSFVELIIAITLLAIVIGPIMNSLIASARVNMDSRKLMCATDVAQGVVEGLSGKSFKGVLAAYDPSLSNLSNGTEFCRIGGTNIYNNHLIKSNGSGTASLGLSCYSETSVSNYNKITTASGTVTTQDLALDSKGAQALLSDWGRDVFSRMPAAGAPGYDASEQYLFMHGNNTGVNKDTYKDAKVILFAYTNIPWENGAYTYDVLGYIVPAVSTGTTDGSFYPYTVKVAVYEVVNGDHKCYAADGSVAEPILTINTGLRNR